MVDAFVLGRFLLDAGLVAAAGWLGGRLMQPRATGILEPGIAWLLAAILVVAASSSILGVSGGFNSWGFFFAHGFVLLALLFVRRRSLERDREAWRHLQDSVRDFAKSGGAARFFALGLLLACGGLAILAAIGEPLVYDALSYRLPRIGQWLQDGHMSPVLTDDQRLNYMSSGQDLVVAWLVGAFRSGFHLTALSQVAGGILLLMATAGFARRSGCSAAASLGSAALVLGLANVAPQWTSAHNDLFAAGIFASAFYLLWVSLVRGEGSVLAGLGLAYALDAKGTVFYVLPSAAIWGACLVWKIRPLISRLVPTAVAGVVGCFIFLGPPFARNQQLYGHLTAPAEALLEHYGPPLTPAGHFDKLALNLRTATAQLLEPYSQPWGLRDASAGLARHIAATLPEHDPYAFDNLDRNGNLQFFLNAGRPNADFSTPGIPIVVLFLAGLVLALARGRQANANWTISWSIGVVLFVLVQNAMLQWHPWAFRYTILVLPWVAIVAVTFLEALPGAVRAGLWTLVLASGCGILIETTFEADQVGWCAWELPRENAALGQGWREWARQLGNESPTLHVALAGDRPLAWLFRVDPEITAHLESRRALPATTAEAAASGTTAWLIVPASMFAGHEGQVMARVWLQRGDAKNDLSVAAYRALRPGEAPQPVVYRNVIRPTKEGFRSDLEFRSWSPSVRLKTAGEPTIKWNYVVHAGASDVRGSLNYPEAGDINLPASAERLTSILIDFVPATEGQPPTRPPVVVEIGSDPAPELKH